jgi:hypothetical protein
MVAAVALMTTTGFQAIGVRKTYNLSQLMTQSAFTTQGNPFNVIKGIMWAGEITYDVVSTLFGSDPLKMIDSFKTLFGLGTQVQNALTQLQNLANQFAGMGLDAINEMLSWYNGLNQIGMTAISSAYDSFFQPMISAFSGQTSSFVGHVFGNLKFLSDGYDTVLKNLIGDFGSLTSAQMNLLFNGVKNINPTWLNGILDAYPSFFAPLINTFTGLTSTQVGNVFGFLKTLASSSIDAVNLANISHLSATALSNVASLDQFAQGFLLAGGVPNYMKNVGTLLGSWGMYIGSPVLSSNAGEYLKKVTNTLCTVAGTVTWADLLITPTAGGGTTRSPLQFLLDLKPFWDKSFAYFPNLGEMLTRVETWFTNLGVPSEVGNIDFMSFNHAMSYSFWNIHWAFKSVIDKMKILIYPSGKAAGKVGLGTSGSTVIRTITGSQITLSDLITIFATEIDNLKVFRTSLSSNSLLVVWDLNIQNKIYNLVNSVFDAFDIIKALLTSMQNTGDVFFSMYDDLTGIASGLP